MRISQGSLILGNVESRCTRLAEMDWRDGLLVTVGF